MILFAINLDETMDTTPKKGPFHPTNPFLASRMRKGAQIEKEIKELNLQQEMSLRFE